MPTPATVEYLVVYGTLLREVGHPSHSILVELGEFMGPVSFHGKLYDLGEYPGVKIAPRTSDIVRGELYRIRETESALEELDAYESYASGNPTSSLFRRETVDVFHPGGKAETAWVYCYNRSVARRPRIASGDYLHFLWARRAAPPE
jgi:pyruvate carboxylase